MSECKWCRCSNDYQYIDWVYHNRENFCCLKCMEHYKDSIKPECDECGIKYNSGYTAYFVNYNNYVYNHKFCSNSCLDMFKYNNDMTHCDINGFGYDEESRARRKQYDNRIAEQKERERKWKREIERDKESRERDRKSQNDARIKLEEDKEKEKRKSLIYRIYSDYGIYILNIIMFSSLFIIIKYDLIDLWKFKLTYLIDLWKIELIEFIEYIYSII